MKTKIFLIATLFISTITFSQSSKKGYDYYQNSSDTKMNKAELIDAMAKDANLSKADAKKTTNNVNYNSSELAKKGNKSRTKGFGATDIAGIEKRTGRNPQTGAEIKSETRHNWMNNPSRARNSKQTIEQTRDLHLRKRPGRTKYNNSSNSSINTTRSVKATDYNSSRSNKRG